MQAIQEFAGSLLPFIVCCAIVALVGAVFMAAFAGLGELFIMLAQVLL
jgi:hypothetical protein